MEPELTPPVDRDPAEDGPEIALILAFKASPEGAYSRSYWSLVRDSSS
jgi:hypothetical protein